MTRLAVFDQLLAQAADTDRQADAIFDRIHAASEAAPADFRGGRPHIPAGFEGRAQEACDLRRMARQLRAEAEEAKPRPAARLSVSLAFAPPPSPTICPATAATPPVPKPDPIEIIVARIMRA